MGSRHDRERTMRRLLRAARAFAPYLGSLLQEARLAQGRLEGVDL